MVRQHRRRPIEFLALERRQLLTAAISDVYGPLPVPGYLPPAVSANANVPVVVSPFTARSSAVEAAASVVVSSSIAEPAAAGSMASPAVVTNSSPDTLTGSLAGHVLFTSGGHGYVWRPPVTDANGNVTTPGYWGVMRSYGYNFMEDMGNQDQLQPYADYALHAGATVVSMRPIGHQVNEVVLDNADPYSASAGGFQIISGSWTANSATAPYWSDHNGADAAHWMFAPTSTTETAVARYTPNIPVAGFYPVYEWTNPGTNNASNDRVSDQMYRINYTGGSVQVKVAANKVGNGWVYLGTYYFAQGVSGANVELSNKSATTGKYVVADGIRFGNGMGDWTEYGTHPVSGYSREDECALYWCYDSLGWTASGTRVANDVVDAGFTTDDESKNFFACDRYAAYMNNSAVGNRDDRLWISFHSNASGSSGTGGAGRGTYGLITGSETTNQEWLAETAGSTVEQEMIAAGFNWASKSDNDPSTTQDNVFGPGGGYSEISNSSTYINGEFDATIIEVAYHDNATDNALLKNPAVRQAVGRAAYHSAIKYFQTFDSLSNTTLLPEPPIDVRSTTDSSGNVTIAWNPGASSTGLAGPYGNAATSYLVHTSTNGYGFDGGVSTTSTSLTFSGLSTTSPTYFMVTAINAGGESMNSYVVVAKPQVGRRAPILIVNNFDRMDGASDEIETKSFGTVYRARAQYNNAYDYVIQAASSLMAYNPNLGIESATDESIALGQVVLSNYQTVIWMSGEESTGDTATFRGATATAVTNYLNAGGKLFVSGSEIAWDLGAKGNGTTFLSGTLHAGYVADDAGTYDFNAGVAGRSLASVAAGSFDDGSHGTYDVDFPDVLSAGSGAQVAMYYSGGTQAAAIQWASGNARLLYLGFPLESIYTASTRNSLVSAAMTYFSASVSVAPSAAPDLSTTSDTGVSSTDNLTNLNNSAGKTLQFTIPGTISGATVKIYDGSTVIGQGIGNGGSLVITTNGTATLSNGVHVLTAKQTEVGLTESAATTTLSITVDTVAPTVTLGAISSPKSAPISSDTIGFSESVTGATLAALKLTRDGGANLLTAGQTLSGSGSGYTLSNLSGITDLLGAYVLTLTASESGITDAAGNALAANASVNWIVSGFTTTSSNDNVVLSRSAAGSNYLDVTVNANPTYTVNVTGLGSISVSTAAGDDTVALDLSRGALTMDSGSSIIVQEGAANTNDSILLTGTTGNDVVSLNSTQATLGVTSLQYSHDIATPMNFTYLGNGGNDSLGISGRLLNFTADPAADGTQLSVNVGSAGSAIFAASVTHLAALNIANNAAASISGGGNKVLVTKGLSLTGSGSLNLNDEDLILDYTGATPLTTIRSALAAGFASAAGIYSSNALANLNHTTGIGYAEASDLGLTQFDGEAVDTTSLLLKYTYTGDTDLDGQMTADDLARVDLGVLKHRTTWLWGDSNYDGIIDSSDTARSNAADVLQTTIL